jgi:integrase
VKRTTGLPLGYEGLRRYFRLKANLAASTLRGTKSAVLFIFNLGGKPMAQHHAEKLDDLLDGFECFRGKPERIRGAPSAAQLQQLIAAARIRLGPECALALVVAHGCGLRANELDALCVEDFDVVGEVVWVNRKARLLTKVCKGFQTERPVTTPEALEVPEAIRRARPTGRFFPNVTSSTLSAFVKQVAQEEGWNPDLWWSGVHNLRHGLAAQVFREGIEHLGRRQLAGC